MNTLTTKMDTLINCFVPKGIEEETKRNVEALGNLDIVGEVTVVDGDIKSSETLRRIADEASTPYTLVFLKNSYIRMGYLALERMVQIAGITGAGMVYADHYQVSADGKRKDAPVIDYQQGSLRDDFNFGSVVLFRTDALKDAAKRMTADYRVAVILYDYFRVFCLDHCAKFAKHCRLSHACHIFKAYFGSTCLYEFVGNGTVIFCSVNGRSCNAESGLRSHSCIESIVYARYYVAHVVQSAEYTGNVNALCVFHLVHELSHICRNGEHTQCVEYTPYGLKKISENPYAFGAINPCHPNTLKYIKRMITEIFTNPKYECVDAYVLDYCRYMNINSDFSDYSRQCFEEYIGEQVPNWPEDIYTYNSDAFSSYWYDFTPGKYYNLWVEWRSQVP